MRTHKEIFTEIYDKNVWGGSGGGSTPENTVEYRAFIQKFLKDYKIQSVVDYGCGDWSFSRLMDWSGVHYIGYDLVESVIMRNRRLYSTGGVTFACKHEEVLKEFPPDLMIVKDVLQHWSNEEIDEFLQRYDWVPLILITNTQGQQEADIQAGDCRPLSAKFPPLSKYNPEILAVIQTTITSEVCLIKNI